MTSAIANMSVSASALIVAVLAFRLLFSKKVSRAFIYAIWGLVLIKLLVPISIPSPLSVFNLFGPISMPQTQAFLAPVPVAQSFATSGGVEWIEPSAAPIRQRGFDFLGIIWLAGTLSLLLASAVSWHSLKRKLRTATLWKDNIYFSDAVKGPIVFGLFAPRIILPSNISQVCGDDDLRFIIAHENAHIKRLDHILKPLSLLALAAHWFNPLVWIAFFVSDIDREISCDEIVIAGAGRDIRGEYATSLVNANTSRRAVANPFAALAFGESNVNKRVSSICGFSPRKTIGSILLAVAAALIFVAVFMTGRASDQTPPGLEVPAFLANENIKAIASQVVPSASRDTGPMYSIEMATNANETQDAGPMHSTEMAPSAAASESAIGLDYAITQAILSLNSPSTQGSLAEGHVVLMVSETASSATVYLSYSAGEYSIENGDIAKLYKTEPAFGILKLQKAQNGGYSLESFQAETWSSLDPGYYDALKNKLPVDAYSKAVGIDASELERLEKAMATGILLGSR